MTGFGELVARRRDELSVAALRSQLLMGRLALTVRDDRVTARDYLEELLVTVRGGRDGDGVVSREQLLLSNDIDTTLQNRRGVKRPSEERWLTAKRRLAATVSALGEGDPAIWPLRMREAETRAVIPQTRSAGLNSMRELLTEAGYPEVRNFRLSLHALNLAAKLSKETDRDSEEEARRITERELVWRQDRYGAAHPFTLVAQAHALLLALTRLETRHDDRALIDGELDEARSLLEGFEGLQRDRSRVLGERHGASVRAVAYQARALRILGEHERAISLAQQALLQRGDDPETLRDDSLLGVLQVVMVTGLLERRREALINADGLARDPQKRPSSHAASMSETARAAALLDDINIRVASALDVLAHQKSMSVWTERAGRLRRLLRS